MWGPIRENALTHNSPGNTRPQSSQSAEPLWTDPGLKKKIKKKGGGGGNWCALADLHFKKKEKKKKSWRGINRQTFLPLQILAYEDKATTTVYFTICSSTIFTEASPIKPEVSPTTIVQSNSLPKAMVEDTCACPAL